MKKLFTLLILLGGVVLAQAQSLKIGGTSISLSGSSTITVSSSAIKSGTVKYNQSAKVLYLDNATIEYDGDCITANVEGLIIDFKGKTIGERGISPIIEADLSPADLERFRTKFPAWRDADAFKLDI